MRYVELRGGAFDGAAYIDVLKVIVRRYPMVERGDVTLVMDNARIHHARIAREYLERKGIEHMLLPKNTPQLNPIENVFGTLKTNYVAMGTPMTRAQMEDQIIRAIDDLNEDMTNYYRHMRKYVQKAMNRENFH